MVSTPALVDAGKRTPLVTVAWTIKHRLPQKYFLPCSLKNFCGRGSTVLEIPPTERDSKVQKKDIALCASGSASLQ
uniref:Uncharacterized protein n=1 Tax=Steinernema glaseri TaxID=37863 RepID=A0A1I7Y282_9BILA